MAAFLLDEAGVVLEASRASASFFAQPAEVLKGSELFAHFEDRSALPELRARYREGQNAAGEVLLRDGQGRLHLDLRCLPCGPARFGFATLRPIPPLEDGRALADARHDANNLMMAVLGYAELLRNYADLPERARDRVRALSEQAGRLHERLQEMIELSRRLTRALQTLDPLRADEKGASHDPKS